MQHKPVKAGSGHEDFDVGFRDRVDSLKIDLVRIEMGFVRQKVLADYFVDWFSIRQGPSEGFEKRNEQ